MVERARAWHALPYHWLLQSCSRSRAAASFSLAAIFYTPRRTRACEISTCSSSASANRAAPVAAEVPSMLRRSILLGEQHADARNGARAGAHRLRASCAKVTPAARRHRDMRRERRVASVRTLALIRVASLVARAASKHSLESSGARRRKGPVHKYQRTLYGTDVLGYFLNFVLLCAGFLRASAISSIDLSASRGSRWCPPGANSSAHPRAAPRDQPA